MRLTPVLFAVACGLAACKTDPPAPPPAEATTPAPASAGTPIPMAAATIPPGAPCLPDRYADFAPAAYRTPTHIVVFVDRSSTATDTSTAGPYGQALIDEIAGPMLANGSAMDLYLIHSNTTGKAQHARATVSAQAPTLAEGDGDLAKKQACDAANVAFVQSVVAAKQTAQAFLRDANTSVAENADQSDVWGALEVVSEAAAADAPGTDLRVVLLTDAMHCTTARCLENTPPGSKAQAETWGREDAARARASLSLNDAVIGRGTYRIVPGEFANKPGFGNLKYYWQAFLGAFGVPEAKVSFN